MRSEPHSEVSLMVKVSVDGAKPVHGTLTVTRKYEHIYSDSPRPDMSWSYIDAAGHYHGYDIQHKVKGGREYPTLDRVSRRMECNGGCWSYGDDPYCEGWDDVYYTCIVCGEEITPGTLTGPHSISVPQGDEWELEVETAIPFADPVSVRITSSTNEWFGFAVVSWLLTSSTGGRSTLQGVTPLGTRKLR